VKRRNVIALLGGAAAWPFVARAQQSGEKHITVLMGFAESDPEYRALVDAFVKELAGAGWVDGRNARIETRWANADRKRANTLAIEAVASQPDVILASSTPVVAALHQATSTIAIVFTIVADPVGEGFVAGFPHPGGNITGFTSHEAVMGGKWVSLLKQIAPGIKRAGIIFNPDTAPGGGNYVLGSFEAGARSLGVEPTAMRVHSDAEIETAIAALGPEQSGLVVMAEAFTTVHQGAIISSTARHNIPAIAEGHQFARGGGLISYGPNQTDIFQRAAEYVDRILRGEKPADLPVQLPAKFELVINLKTAKSFGMTVPLGLLNAADEVIE
jgi:putative ABC transport system substrate-binding protein